MAGASQLTTILSTPPNVSHTNGILMIVVGILVVTMSSIVVHVHNKLTNKDSGCKADWGATSKDSPDACAVKVDLQYLNLTAIIGIVAGCGAILLGSFATYHNFKGGYSHEEFFAEAAY